MNFSDQYAVVYEQKVAWGDMDAFAHVNNVQYYRYMESARIEYFNRLNIFSHDINTVVSSSQCNYLKPVFYPDTLLIGAQVVDIRNSAFRMEYHLFSQQQNCIVATGQAVVVCVDQKEMKKTLIPAPIKQGIIDLEKTVNKDLL